jgi:hypothetical protein
LRLQLMRSPRGHRRLRRALALATLLGIAVATPVRADRASGTWTGAVEARGNYYWEQSTRVVAPAIHAELESPEGVRLNGHYLVDSITSASQAAGTQEDVAFTEIRHDFSLGGGYEFDLGEAQLRLDGNMDFSFEPDYRSVGAGINAALSLDQRATTLRARVFYIHDDVSEKVRGGPSGISDRGQVGELNGIATTLVWDQVLAPNLTAQVGYDLVYLTGFLQNAYRRIAVQGTPRDENHPGTRWRHAVSGRLAWFYRPTRTAFHAMYRAYVDSWDVSALTPEARVYQELGAFAQLRLRYRYYTQTAAYFYEANSANYTLTEQYVSADPKMSRFHSHLAGIQLLLKMEFLEGTSLHFFREASLDLNFDYIWRTNRFGNGVIAEAGFRVPF